MRSRIGKWIAAVVGLAVLSVLIWFGWQRLEQDYVFWNGILLPRDAQTLNISGKKMRRPEAFLEIPDLRQLDARDTGMTVEQYDETGAASYSFAR